MSEDQRSLDTRIELLTAELSLLRQRVEQIAVFVGAPAMLPGVAAEPVSLQSAAAPVPTSEPLPAPATVTAREDASTWEGESSRLLSRASTVSFLLVLALILRTVTDNSIVPPDVGSFIGIGYSALLLAVGWFMYARKGAQAPVFTACGSILIFAVIAESNLNQKFHLLPLLPAFALLIATGAVTAAVSYRYRVRLPFSIGTVGMALAAVVVTFHEQAPDFRYLIVTLLVANLLGHFTMSLEKCKWVGWTLSLVTAATTIWWAFSIRSLYINPTTAESATSMLPWFLAGVGAFGCMYLAIASWEILAGQSEQVGNYYLALPTLTVIWSFGSALFVTFILAKSMMLVSGLGLLVALLHIYVTRYLAKRRSGGRGGLGAICNAGALLLAMALPIITGNALFALPILCAIAFMLIISSGAWQSGGVRLTSYLLQLHTTAIFAFLQIKLSPASPIAILIVVGFILSGLAFLQYQWARSNPPPADVRFFARIDTRDISAGGLLILSLLSTFFLFRAGSFASLTMMGGHIDNAFRATQSVFINAAAAGMVIWAYVRKSGEIRNIAIAIILIGAVKVAIYDLMSIKGIPLVMSILSFAIATATLSIFLSRWQRRVKGEEQ
jgi:hypothetical protein